MGHQSSLRTSCFLLYFIDLYHWEFHSEDPLFFLMSEDRNGLSQPEFVMKKWDQKSDSQKIFFFYSFEIFFRCRTELNCPSFCVLFLSKTLQSWPIWKRVFPSLLIGQQLCPTESNLMFVIVFDLTTKKINMLTYNNNRTVGIFLKKKQQLLDVITHMTISENQNYQIKNLWCKIHLPLLYYFPY
jgi:hypothetical protein